MKYEGKIIKYIFFIIIIGLLIIAMYIISSDNHKFAADIKEKAKKEKIKDSISIGITNFDTVNPLLTRNKDVQYLLKLVYKPLLEVSKDFKIEPSLAEEYSKLDDKTYIIKLKEDIYWNDGEKFTAEDVEFTINTLKSTWQHSIYFENIKNIENILIIDDYTLKIYLKEEIPFFEYKLVLPIMPKHQYNENFELIDVLGSGTGDYHFENITSEKIILRNNNAKTKEIDVIIYDKSSKMYSDFVKQKLDLITTGNIEYERYIGTIGYKSIVIPDRRFCYLLINKNNSMLKDDNLRKAIGFAINKKEIIYNVYKNKYLEMNFPGSSALNIDYNSNKAREILEQSGYNFKNNKLYNNNKKVNLSISINSQERENMQVAEFIKKDLENLGIIINIVSLSKANYEYNLENGYYDLILANSILCLEPDYREYFKFNNNETDNLLSEIENIDNEKVREEKIEALKKISQEEIPFIGLYVNTNTLLLNKELKGDFEANWYNIFYNINTWYEVESRIMYN